MSGGIEWFRWHHGAVDDPKFTLIARKAKQPRHLVLAAWVCLLEYASRANPRGDVTGCDAETLAVTLDADEAATSKILAALVEKHLLTRDAALRRVTVTAWDRRQPKREDNSTERVRAWRERQQKQSRNAVTETNGNADETQRNGRGTGRGEERRVEESREEDSYQHQPFGKTPARADADGPSDFTPTKEKPRLEAGEHAKLDLAKRMIGHLDGCRAELWHDDTMARSKPHRLDLPTALGWIDAGADEALVIGVLEAVLDRQHSAGDLPADSLRYFDRPVREALAARGCQAEAETPRRELTEEEGDRIRLDTWVKMSPGHGDRDDAWYSMRYPRPTPAEVAEARRRLGFDQLAETTTGSDSGPDPLTVP